MKFVQLFSIGILLMFMTIFFAFPASAMNYISQEINHKIIVTAIGKIEVNEDKVFSVWKSVILKNKHIDRIDLDSPGGYIVDAWNFAKIVHDEHINTGVIKNGECDSACVLIWAAGQHKSVPYNGAVGVHNCHTPIKSETNRCSRGMADFFLRNGAPPEVVHETIITPNSGLYYLTKKDFKDWKVKITK